MGEQRAGLDGPAEGPEELADQLEDWASLNEGVSFGDPAVVALCRGVAAALRANAGGGPEAEPAALAEAEEMARALLRQRDLLAEPPEPLAEEEGETALAPLPISRRQRLTVVEGGRDGETPVTAVEAEAVEAAPDDEAVTDDAIDADVEAPVHVFGDDGDGDGDEDDGAAIESPAAGNDGPAGEASAEEDYSEFDMSLVPDASSVPKPAAFEDRPEQEAPAAEPVETEESPVAGGLPSREPAPLPPMEPPRLRPALHEEIARLCRLLDEASHGASPGPLPEGKGPKTPPPFAGEEAFPETEFTDRRELADARRKLADRRSGAAPPAGREPVLPSLPPPKPRLKPVRVEMREWLAEARIYRALAATPSASAA